MAGSSPHALRFLSVHPFVPQSPQRHSLVLPVVTQLEVAGLQVSIKGQVLVHDIVGRPSTTY
ncbi:MAG: hypothetical protein HY655_03370 [Acidobacteria bacterium]|nr:hypothetical protein [Acidobacteriota bacterium]